MGELKGKHSHLLGNTVLDICQPFTQKEKGSLMNITNYRLNYDCESKLTDYSFKFKK